MEVMDLCARDVVSVPASTSVRQAAAAMRDQQVGALAVTDPYQPGRVIGVVTDRDLVLELLATGRPVEGQAIGDLCRTDLIGVPANASLETAVRALQAGGVRRLLVMGPDDAVVGLVSLDDLLVAIANDLDAVADALRAGRARERDRLHRPAQPASRGLYLTRNEP